MLLSIQKKEKIQLLKDAFDEISKKAEKNIPPKKTLPPVTKPKKLDYVESTEKLVEKEPEKPPAKKSADSSLIKKTMSIVKEKEEEEYSNSDHSDKEDKNKKSKSSSSSSSSKEMIEEDVVEEEKIDESNFLFNRPFYLINSKRGGPEYLLPNLS